MNPHQLSGKEFESLQSFLNMWLVVSSSELLVCVWSAKVYVCIFPYILYETLNYGKILLYNERNL